VEHEHVKLALEAVLSSFATFKLMHEIYEVIHHLLKLKIVVRILKGL